MDPWSILGIAASILQFVDVGYELISGAKEAYSSGEGMKRQTAELRDLAKDIQRQNERILSSGSLSKDEKALKSLVEGSLDIAQKLDARLVKLVVDDNTKFRPLRSAKVSVKAMIWQNDLEELKKRLLGIQNHVQQRLSIILQAQQTSDFAAAIRQLQGENKALGISMHKSFSQVFEELQQLASTQLDQTQDYHDSLTNLSSQIILTIKEGKKALKSRKIIGSLWFNVLKDREDDIEKAYDDTLDWLFDPNATHFCNWLEHGDGIFWINGLAGSGKSTLMKFAFREKRTTDLLEKWSNGRQLHIANFFFWSSGLEMQKSQRGLFQSLLCQILQSDPDLVSAVCPNRHPNEPWSTHELKEAYENIRQHASAASAFCFFIDGLDEYSGEETEIVDILKNLSQISNVKICASSRPWNTFGRAFPNLEKTLVVEEHTMTDMKRYVHGMLEENVEFTKLVSQEPRCLELVPEIASRAKGVWLWVYLVVKDLTKDIEGKENYEFLKKRLENIPPRLEAYFEDIINRVDPIYKEETAQIFLLTVEAVRPLPLLALRFLEMERKDSEYAMTIDWQKLNILDVYNICETWSIKLKSRCRDLLKTQRRDYWPNQKPKEYVFSWRIEYLHRTVRDFLLKNHQTKLYEAATGKFEAKVSLCRATLSMLQIHVESILAMGDEKWAQFKNSEGVETLSFVYEFLYHARQLELLGKGHSQFSAIDMMEIVVKRLFQDNVDPWASRRTQGLSNNFLLLLVELGLDQYVRHILDRGALLGSEKTELLYRALVREFDFQGGVSFDWAGAIQRSSSLPDFVFACAPIDLDFIEYLLRKCEIPRQNGALELFLRFCVHYRYRKIKVDSGLWFEESKLLVQYGTRLDERLEIKGSFRALDLHVPSEDMKTVRDAVTYLFSSAEVKELERIAQMQANTGWSFWSLLPQSFQ